jgi:hypothetical protein
VLESDHQPLKWILTNTKLTGKLARWALMLSEFDFEVVHRPGIDNEMDCLSRFPQETMVNSAGVRQEGELEDQCVWSAAACLAWLPLQAGAALPGARPQTDAGAAGERPQTVAETVGGWSQTVAGAAVLRAQTAAGAAGAEVVPRQQWAGGARGGGRVSLPPPAEGRRPETAVAGAAVVRAIQQRGLRRCSPRQRHKLQERSSRRQ